MARYETDQRITRIDLEPKATPVDTFVQAPRSPLLDVAEILKDLNPKLTAMLDAKSKKDAEDDLIRGEAEAYGQSAEDIKAGVADGTYPAQYSPAYVKGLQNGQGQRLGAQLVQDFGAAFDAWDGKNSDDPNAYADFLKDFLTTNVDVENLPPQVLKTLQPFMEKIDELGGAMYTEYRSKLTYAEGLNGQVAGVMQAIDAFKNEHSAAPDDETPRYSGLWTTVEESRAKFLSMGGNAADFDKQIIEAIGVKALVTRDPKLLEFFDQKVPGTDHTYGDTVEGAKQRRETEAAIDVIKRQEAADGYTQSEREAKKAKDNATRNAQEWLADNPGQTLPDNLMQDGLRVDGGFRSDVAQWQQTLSKGTPTDPAKLLEIGRQMLDADDPMAVVREAMRKGWITSYEDLKTLTADARAADSNKDKLKETVGGKTFTSLMEVIEKRTKATEMFGDPVRGLSNEGLEAQYDFKRRLMLWLKANPDADAFAIEEQTAKIGKSIIEQLKERDDFNAGSDYERDPKVNAEVGDNPYTGLPNSEEPQAAQPGAQPEAAAPSPAQAVEEEAAKQESAGEIQRIIDGLTDKEKADLTQDAKDHGMTLEEYADAFLDSTPNTSAGPAPATPESLAPDDGKTWWERFRDNNDSGYEDQVPQGDFTTRLGRGLTGQDTGAPVTPPAPSPRLIPQNVPTRDSPSPRDKRGFIKRTRDWLKSDASDGSVQVASADPNDWTGLPGNGPTDLVAGTQAGRSGSADIEHLRPELKGAVSKLQASWGSTLPIVSGFRDKNRNKRAGGASKSQHIHGNAVDIDVSGMPKAKRLELIRMASAQGFGGIGVYANSIHLDLGARRSWGPSHSSDSIPGWARGAVREHLASTAKAGSWGGEVPEGRTTPPINEGIAYAFIQQAIARSHYTGPSGQDGWETTGAATALKDLIKDHEAGGNYNAVYGNAGSTRDLSQFTLDQILATQVAARRMGKASTATGAYQFLHKTLVSLKRDMGLTGKERFTPQLQDAMADALLARRGLHLFQAGKISARQFALRLSQEWASLPDPRTGRSYYAGDGLNASRVPRARVFAALGLA